MKVRITGICGFVGSVLARELRAWQIRIGLHSAPEVVPKSQKFGESRVGCWPSRF